MLILTYNEKHFNRLNHYDEHCTLGMPKSPLYSEYSFEVCEDLIVKLLEEFGLVIAVTFFEKKPWLRMSANIYNCKQDFVQMKDAIAKALNIEIK